MSHFLSSALGALLGLGLALPAMAAPLTYQAVQIGGSIGRYTSASDINNSGQVTGYVDLAGATGNRAYITGPNGRGLTLLGTLGGTYSTGLALNDAGQVTGQSNLPGDGGAPHHAFITGRHGTGMTDLGTLGGNSSVGSGINNAGRVTGGSATADSAYHAFITGPNGRGMTDLGSLGGRYSTGNDINNAGRVTGTSYVTTGPEDFRTQHAFITGPNGRGMIDIGTLGGNLSIGFGINDAGQVTGQSDFAGDLYPDFYLFGHAFITGANGGTMRDIGTLGGRYSIGYDINNAGQVVGISTLAGNNEFLHAFVTGPNGAGMIDLNDLVDLPGEDIFTHAWAINDRGQVIAGATDGHAYLLSPFAVAEPLSGALVLTGLGLAGATARRRQGKGQETAGV